MKVITATTGRRTAAGCLLVSTDDAGTPSPSRLDDASASRLRRRLRPRRRLRHRSPRPKPKPVPKAKDGTNLAACRDGDCIVQVGSGRTTIKFSGGKLVITKVDAKFAYFVLTGDYGSGNGSLGSHRRRSARGSA